MSKKRKLHNLLFSSDLANSSKKLCANLRFITNNTGNKVISVISPEKGDGKTAVASNLASAFANNGYRTLLIDADIYKKSITRILGSKADQSMSSVLFGNCRIEEAISTTPIKDLYFLDCVSDVLSIPETISHPNFNSLFNLLKDNFDSIIFDTPPLLSCVDSSLVSSISDVSLLVVQQNKTKKTSIKTTIEQLKIADVEVAGIVMTGSTEVKSYYYRAYK